MEDVVGKMAQCADYSSIELSQARLNKIRDAVSNLETMISARSILDLMCDR